MTQTTTTLVDDTTSLEMISQVRELINQVLGQADIDDTTDLIDTGVLDSLALVSLIMELEMTFDFTVSYDDLEVDAFRSILSITSFVSASKKN